MLVSDDKTIMPKPSGPFMASRSSPNSGLFRVMDGLKTRATLRWRIAPRRQLLFMDTYPNGLPLHEKWEWLCHIITSYQSVHPSMYDLSRMEETIEKHWTWPQDDGGMSSHLLILPGVPSWTWFCFDKLSILIYLINHTHHTCPAAINKIYASMSFSLWMHFWCYTQNFGPLIIALGIRLQLPFGEDCYTLEKLIFWSWRFHNYDGLCVLTLLILTWSYMLTQ